MNRTRKGQRYERYAIQILEAKGYRVHRCVRTAQRRGASWVTISADILGCDLIAKRGGERTRWIQVTSTPASSKTVELETVPWNNEHDSVEIWQWQGGSGKRNHQHFVVHRREHGYTAGDLEYKLPAAGGRAAGAAEEEDDPQDNQVPPCVSSDSYTAQPSTETCSTSCSEPV